jgi:hypothetical protein
MPKKKKRDLVKGKERIQDGKKQRKHSAHLQPSSGYRHEL